MSPSPCSEYRCSRHVAQPDYRQPRQPLTHLGGPAPWPGWSARLTDDIACLAALLLAIAASRLLGISNVGWAAFSAYTVIRASLADSIARGILRVAGTLVGVSLACLLAPQLMRATILMSIALALVGAITLYRTLLGRHGYG